MNKNYWSFLIIFGASITWSANQRWLLPTSPVGVDPFATATHLILTRITGTECSFCGVGETGHGWYLAQVLLLLT